MSNTNIIYIIIRSHDYNGETIMSFYCDKDSALVECKKLQSHHRFSNAIFGCEYRVEKWIEGNKKGEEV